MPWHGGPLGEVSLMELKMLEKLQNIVRDANQIRGLKAWYEANPHRDKCGPVFGVYFIRQSAELEIKEVQELLDSVKKEAEEPCTTE